MATLAQQSYIARLGAVVLDIVATLGEMTLFVAQMVSWMIGRRTPRNTLIPSMFQIGVQSVPVVAITGSFIGMVLAVQAYNQFRMMGLETRLGSVINVSILSELGPVLAATMLAGRIGSAMAAEIGTMNVTEQIDALRSLGTNPIHYLVVPRFLACVILIPLLTIVADFMGVVAGAMVSIHILHIDGFHYWKHSRNFVGSWEIYTGLLKSLFFGAQIAVISCYRGFKSTAGAEGVGRAATEAFVYSFIAILASDFFLNILLNGIYAMLWPNATVRLR